MMNDFSPFDLQPRPAIVRSVNFFEEQAEEQFCNFLDDWEREERTLMREIDGGNGHMFDIQYMNDRETDQMIRKAEKWDPDFRAKIKTQHD